MLIALLNGTDLAAHPDTHGFSPMQIKDGWEAWAQAVHLDDVCAALDGRVLIHGPAGWGDTRRIGTMADGRAATSEAWSFRDLEYSDFGQANKHLFGDGFRKVFEKRGQKWRNMMCLIGAPGAKNNNNQARHAYMETIACNIINILDAYGVVAANGRAEEALVGAHIYGMEPGGQPCQMENWSYSLSQKQWATQFTRPKNKGDLYVIQDATGGIHDPEARFAQMARAIGVGFSPCGWVLPSPTEGWGNGPNLSLKQVGILKSMV